MFTITVPGSKDKTYTIRKVTETTWVCSCPDHIFQAQAKDYTCKHIAELLVSLAAFTNNSSRSAAANKTIRVAHENKAAAANV